MVVKGCLKCLRACTAFVGGFLLVQIYYNYMLRNLLPYHAGGIVALGLSISLGLLNVAAVQIRCISLLTLPMYFGKDGRRVQKALILTYVVAGPITNMSLNAREVVRVFACSNELARNLSIARDVMIARPLVDTVEGMTAEIDRAAETFQYFQDVASPIESEIEYTGEIEQSIELTRAADAFLQANRSQNIESKYRMAPQDEEASIYQKTYLMKTEYRCHNMLSQAVFRCTEQMSQVRRTCVKELPRLGAPELCELLLSHATCDVPRALGYDICDSRSQVSPGFEIGYAALKKIKRELMKNSNEITIINKEIDRTDLYDDLQAAKETGERVKQAFEDKFSIIQSAITVVNICLALLSLRLVIAAQRYHDLYLTSIDFDNVYVTDQFKRIDKRRGRRNQYTLMPLKKMERSRYVDVYSLAYATVDRHRLLTQTLKVLLEVVTATTFVMLDRLFYEALDVVRKNAEMQGEVTTRGLEIEVQGAGIIANTLRAFLSNLSGSVQNTAMNSCLPQPRGMPTIFYLKIYGGYLWVLLLLCANPYTIRLRRLICSYFYPRREKQRVLHLYNDILKKRIKLDATLRRKAVQAVRAHYLSGESLLMRFPHVLGWLRILPAARMACLICGEIEPRNPNSGWKACVTPKCPFLYCAECWRDVRGRCLACDPAIAQFSDQDSLSEDELPVY